MTITLAEEDFEVTRYKFSPGIHFEQLGQVKFFNTEFQLITYVKLDNLWDKFDTIQNLHKQTSRICQNKVVMDVDALKKLCTNFETVMSEVVPTVQGQVIELKELLGHDNRKKRAWFDIIGKGAKILFGTMDQEDAKYFSDKVHNFEEYEQDSIDIVKKQSKIVQSTILNFNATIGNLHENENKIQKNIQMLESFSRAFYKNLNQTNMRMYLDEHLVLFQLIFTQFQNQVSTAVQSILLSQKGILHSSIMSPAEILRQLSSVVQHIPNGLTFPLPLSVENQYNLVKLLKINVLTSKGSLIFVMNMPLVEIHEYELFRVSPFPAIVSQNKFMFIQPATAFLAVDKNRIQYIALTENEESKCEPILKNSFLCKQESPVLMTHIHSNCEIKIFLRDDKNLDRCDKRIIHFNSGHFIQLKTSNSWLFAFPNPEVLTINCKGKNPQDVVLSGIGKITVKSGCKGYSYSSILSPTQKLSNNLTVEFIPNFNLNQDCCDDIFKGQDDKIMPALDNHYQKITVNVQDLNVASHKLDNIIKAAEDLEHKTKTQTFMRNSSVLAYTLVFFVVAFISYKVYKKCRKSHPCCERLCIKVEQNSQPKLELSIREERNVSTRASREVIPSVNFNRSEGVNISSLRKGE
jgi:Baculovirus F protein